MDSVTINQRVAHRVNLKVDNGDLAASVFDDSHENSFGYSSIGTTSTAIDRIYYDTLVLDKSGTIGINLTSLPVSPPEASGGAVVKIVGLYVEPIDNTSGTNASSLRIGDSSGTNMAKLWWGSVSTTVTVGGADYNGHYSHHDATGVAVGGNSIKFTNLDSSNTLTFNVLIIGRSA